MAIAGTILNLAGLVFAFIPFFGAFISLPCLTIGTALSGMGFQQRRDGGESLLIPALGLLFGIVTMVILIIWLAILGDVIADYAPENGE